MAGALLPDAALKTDGSYMRSHFVNIDKKWGKRHLTGLCLQMNIMMIQ